MIRSYEDRRIGHNYQAASGSLDGQSMGKLALSLEDNRSQSAAQGRPINAMTDSSLIQLKKNILQKQATGVIQLYGFRVGQDGQTMDWLKEKGIYDNPIFAGLKERFETNRKLTDDDEEGINLLFLTSNKTYREFSEADIDIHFILNTLHVGSVKDFTNAYKQFFHLWKRYDFMIDSRTGGHPTLETKLLWIQSAILNLTHHLAGEEYAPASRNKNLSGLTTDKKIILIKQFARAQKLAFPSKGSAVTHYIKHGTFYNGGKVTGFEHPEHVRAGYREYVDEANYVVEEGRVTGTDTTLASDIFTFEYGDGKAIVSFDPATSNAMITTYFPSENIDFVNDNSTIPFTDAIEHATYKSQTEMRSEKKEARKPKRMWDEDYGMTHGVREPSEVNYLRE
jgi:hypothetical protein